jgi:hypothetical protein
MESLESGTAVSCHRESLIPLPSSRSWLMDLCYTLARITHPAPIRPTETWFTISAPLALHLGPYPLEGFLAVLSQPIHAFYITTSLIKIIHFFMKQEEPEAPTENLLKPKYKLQNKR